MGVLSIDEDARAAFDVIDRGGTCILPMDVGYAFLGGTDESIMHIFNTKKHEKCDVASFFCSNF